MFKIIRINDNKTFKVESYKFVVFNKDGRGKELIDNPEIGTSLILPPYNAFTQWLTSPIVSIVDDYNFDTKNSTYQITKIE